MYISVLFGNWPVTNFYLNSLAGGRPPVLCSLYCLAMLTVLTTVLINLRDALHACSMVLGFIMYMKYLA